MKILEEKLLKLANTRENFLFILINNEKKDLYKSKLLKQSIKNLKEFFKLKEKDIIIENLGSIAANELLKNFVVETPYYIYVEKNDENDILPKWIGTGYYIKRK